MLKDKFEDGDGVRDDVGGRSRNDDNHPPPPHLIYHPKVLLLTLRRSSVGVTKTVKRTSAIHVGKGRLVPPGRGGGEGEGM